MHDNKKCCKLKREAEILPSCFFLRSTSSLYPPPQPLPPSQEGFLLCVVWTCFLRVPFFSIAWVLDKMFFFKLSNRPRWNVTPITPVSLLIFFLYCGCFQYESFPYSRRYGPVFPHYQCAASAPLRQRFFCVDEGKWKGLLHRLIAKHD